jgi:hypothetical protein
LEGSLYLGELHRAAPPMNNNRSSK